MAQTSNSIGLLCIDLMVENECFWNCREQVLATVIR